MGQIVYRLMKQPANSADQKRAAWVASLMPGAEVTALKLGISPEAIVAQAALETGWGRSAIGNNIFGIKANGGWKGKTQEVATWEHIDGRDVQMMDRFRDYDNIEASIADHFRFLEENSRYRKAGVFDRAGDEAYFAALSRAGYATDPAYAAKLGSILRTVKGYTAGMERVELGQVPKGYEVTPAGNVVNPDPRNGTIVKDSKAGENATWLGQGIALASPVLAALQGLDWRVVAVVGAVSLVLGLVAIWKLRSIRKARLEMARQGIV